MFALEIHTKCVIVQLPQCAWALACVRINPSVLQCELNDSNQLNEELYIHCTLDFATHNYVKLRHITIDIQEN